MEDSTPKIQISNDQLVGTILFYAILGIGFEGAQTSEVRAQGSGQSERLARTSEIFYQGYRI
jgi:hypothetical protein